MSTCYTVLKEKNNSPGVTAVPNKRRNSLKYIFLGHICYFRNLRIQRILRMFNIIVLLDSQLRWSFQSSMVTGFVLGIIISHEIIVKFPRPKKNPPPSRKKFYKPSLSGRTVSSSLNIPNPNQAWAPGYPVHPDPSGNFHPDFPGSSGNFPGGSG